MKIVWTAILHAVGNPSFFPWPLRMCVYGYVSTGYLCHDSSTEFLIYSPGMFHLFPSPCMPHKRWMVLSFDIPSKELCGGEFLLAISNHEWPTTENWTSYVPVYKSLVVAPSPRHFSLGLASSRSHPLFAFLPPPLTSFPTPLYFWAPCLLASVFFLEIVGNCPFLQSSWCYLFQSCITEKKLWERSLHQMPPQGTWVLKSSYFPEEFLSQPLKMFFFYIPSYLHITLQNTQLHSPPLPSYIKD